MWISGKNNIRAACFLVAFAAVGAGFMLREKIRNNADEERRLSYERLTVSESAENLEKLSMSLAELKNSSSEQGVCLLSDIRLYSELASSALGHMEMSGNGLHELFSFLSALSELSETAVYNISKGNASPEKELLLPAVSYARAIVSEALPHLPKDSSEFEGTLERIFSDTAFETTLYENGYGELVSSHGFDTVVGGLTEQSEAVSTAREELGKNAYVEVRFSEGEIPVYHIGGKNISAMVSARGGLLMQFLFDLPEGEERIDETKASELAEAFVSEKISGNEEKRQVSSEHSSGLYIFEFVPIQNGVLCLDERILVGVSHGSGRICLFDATEYYRYHKKSLSVSGDIISPQSVMEEYALKIEPELCKIERKPGIESLCYKIVREENGYETEFFISAVSGMRID